MAENETSPKVPGFLRKNIGGIPLYIWIVVGAAGLGIGLYFRSKSSTNSTNTATSQAAQNALSQPSSDTVPSTSASPVYVLSSSPDTDNNSGNSTSGNNNNASSDITNGNTNPQKVATGGTTNAIKIRSSQATSGGPSQAYDKKSKGVPFTTGPNGKSFADIPYGASVVLNGSPQSGANNLPGNAGSTIWYPVTYNGQNGFVSSYDLVGIGSGGSRQGYQTNRLAS